jgi:hypothetical protein
MTTLLSSLQSVWFQQYNSPDSWWPLVLPTILWGGCWYYARLYRKIDFARWYKVHTLHHVGAIAIASCSLYYNNNDIVNERVGVLWSFPYFLIDIIDCIYMRHILYIAHGVTCAILGLCNYNIPLLRALRMNSKASFIETSSVVLYQVKQYRQPWLFVVFAIVYTLCRIVWIPIMGMELLDNGMVWTDVIFLLLVAFYGLQIHWWIKILKILIKGGDSDRHKEEDSVEKNKEK